MTEERKTHVRFLAPLDIDLILMRQELVLRMIEAGRLDQNEGLRLYEEQARLDVVLGEKKALMKGEVTQLAKLIGQFYELPSEDITNTTTP